MIYENVKRLCEKHKTNIATVEKACGIANGTIGKWWKNGRVPNYANLSAVANALETTIAYLTGETDDPSAGIKKERPADGEAPDQDKLLEIVRDSQDMSFLLKVMDEVNKSMQKLK